MTERIVRISGNHTINRGLQRVAAELLEPDMIGSLVGVAALTFVLDVGQGLRRKMLTTVQQISSILL